MTTEFHHNPANLTRPRPFGISAYMRIKNEEQFVRLAIESHLPFYDEIIAVYNDCSDNTEAILLALQQQHPGKIKVFHYLPRVHPVRTPEHAATAGHDDDVHSSANYYNYAVSKCTYSIATKFDADHLAIPHTLEPALKKIRAEFAAGADKLFLFSGLNVIRNESGKLGMVETGLQLAGNGDHWYHRIDERSFFVNHTNTQHLNQKLRWGVPAEYVGLFYFHLKYLRTDRAKSSLENFGCMSFADFATRAHVERIAADLKLTRRIRLALYRNKTYFDLMHKLTGGYPGIRTMRLIDLYERLQEIDFEKDAARPLRDI